MKTYVTVTVSSEGAKASEVVKAFQELGFDTTLGNHDFVYDWKNKDIPPQKVIDFVDKVQERLRGTNVRIQFTTIH